MIEGFRRIAGFTSRPNFLATISILSFLSGISYIFLLFGDLFFISIIIEAIIWIAGLILASAAGFAAADKGIGKSVLAGARTMILLHVPRYLSGILGNIASYLWTSYDLGGREMGPLVSSTASLFIDFGVAVLLITLGAGSLCGAIGWMIGRK